MANKIGGSRLIFLSISIVLIAILTVAVFSYDERQDKEKQRFVYAKLQSETGELRDSISKSILNNMFDAKEFSEVAKNIPGTIDVKVLQDGSILVMKSGVDMEVVFKPSLVGETVTWSCTGTYPDIMPKWCAERDKSVE